jgi:hypothetical protein
VFAQAQHHLAAGTAAGAYPLVRLHLRAKSALLALPAVQQQQQQQHQQQQEQEQQPI